MGKQEEEQNQKAKQAAIVKVAVAVILLVLVLAGIWVFGGSALNKNGQRHGTAANHEQSEVTEAQMNHAVTEDTQNVAKDDAQEVVKDGTQDVVTDSTQDVSEAENSDNVQNTDQTMIQHGAKIICIDAGHQSHGDSTKEPNGPGSSDMKARVTGGTRGTTTGVYEYELNLDIALQLQEEFVKRGYKVCMTRTTHDVNLSNMERAQYAAREGADICIRIHANGADASTASGAMALAPSTGNPYVSNLASESQRLGQCILDSYCSATGMRNRGVTTSDSMTGINWCTMPVTILEMGYMTNPTDDANMENDAYQMKMVQGIADGVDAYYQ